MFSCTWAKTARQWVSSPLPIPPSTCAFQGCVLPVQRRERFLLSRLRSPVVATGKLSVESTLKWSQPGGRWLSCRERTRSCVGGSWPRSASTPRKRESWMPKSTSCTANGWLWRCPSGRCSWRRRQCRRTHWTRRRRINLHRRSKDSSAASAAPSRKGKLLVFVILAMFRLVAALINDHPPIGFCRKNL